jgi:hypothetical protein
MATSGVMTKTISAATRVAEPKVALIVRELREADLLTTGARGVNAAEMTPLDAARVLIALLASDRPVNARKTVVEFGRLRGQAVEHRQSKVSHPFMLNITGKSFAEDLTTVIQTLAKAPEREAWINTIRWLESHVFHVYNTEEEPIKMHRLNVGNNYFLPNIRVAITASNLEGYIELMTTKCRYCHQGLFNQPLKYGQPAFNPPLEYGQLASDFENTLREYWTWGISTRRELTANSLILISADFGDH